MSLRHAGPAPCRPCAMPALRYPRAITAVTARLRRYEIELAFDKVCSELTDMRMEFRLEAAVNSQGKTIEVPIRSVNHRKIFLVIERQIYSTQQILLSECTFLITYLYPSSLRRVPLFRIQYPYSEHPHYSVPLFGIPSLRLAASEPSL
jgi:hypothetical protein